MFKISFPSTFLRNHISLILRETFVIKPHGVIKINLMTSDLLKNIDNLSPLDTTWKRHKAR
jgi:hypothetical protein